MAALFSRTNSRKAFSIATAVVTVPFIGVIGYADLHAAKTTREIAAAAQPSVVLIKCLRPNGWGVGTGFLRDRHGYITTARHVAAEDCSKISVNFKGEPPQPAQLIGSNEGVDIAVLKIEYAKHHPGLVGEEGDKWVRKVAQEIKHEWPPKRQPYKPINRVGYVAAQRKPSPAA
jgi:S1-C subfamily serine protease